MLNRKKRKARKRKKQRLEAAKEKVYRKELKYKGGQ